VTGSEAPGQVPVALLGAATEATGRQPYDGADSLWPVLRRWGDRS